MRNLIDRIRLMNPATVAVAVMAMVTLAGVLLALS